MTRPNILWISFEDTNPFYGCYGDPVARTPNVDRLAAEGCIFPRTFSTAGVCAPARSAVITGMYPISIGTHHMRTTHTNCHTPELPTPYSACPPAYVKCFSEYLRAAGYYCTNNVKTDYQFEPPVTAWDECSEQAHWRNRPDPEQPFFAVFNPMVTHESGMWPERCPEPRFDPDAMELPPYFPDTPAVRTAMARMYTNIETADAYMGELLQQLEEDGLAENTIVMHWSDHGPMPRGKRWPYDSGIHVPMIVRWPGGLAAGSRDERLVSTIDLAPTVLSLCGVPMPQHLQGQAFLGPDAGEERTFVFASRDRYDESYDMIRAARDRRFKYIRHYHPELPYLQWIPFRNKHPILQEMWRLHLRDELSGAQRLMFEPRPAEELYDTEVDPWEINNLADDPAYAEQLQRLRQAVDDWTDRVGDLGRVDEADMVRSWYPNGVRPRTAAPVFVPISDAEYGRHAFRGGEIPPLPVPARIALHCATQGASLCWTTETGHTDAVRWHIYTGPIPLQPGTVTLRARAVRIGYEHSHETTIPVTVSG
ncbi:MAG: sulfatase [Planctomycetota bacterium]